MAFFPLCFLAWVKPTAPSPPISLHVESIEGRPSVCKAGGQLSPETCCLGSLSLGFQPPELEGTTVESPLVCHGKDLAETSSGTIFIVLQFIYITSYLPTPTLPLHPDV